MTLAKRITIKGETDGEGNPITRLTPLHPFQWREEDDFAETPAQCRAGAATGQKDRFSGTLALGPADANNTVVAAVVRKNGNGTYGSGEAVGTLVGLASLAILGYEPFPLTFETPDGVAFGTLDPATGNCTMFEPQGSHLFKKGDTVEIDHVSAYVY